jgi:hypothetical protein
MSETARNVTLEKCRKAPRASISLRPSGASCPRFGRQKTITGNATSGAQAALTAKLPNAATTGGVIFAPVAGVSQLNAISAVQRWRIKSIFASYGGAASAGALVTITDGAFTMIAAAANLNPLDLRRRRSGSSLRHPFTALVLFPWVR